MDLERMNGPRGALRLIERASVRLTQEVAALAASVEQRLDAGDEEALRQAVRILTDRLRLHLAAMTPEGGVITTQQVVGLARGLPAGVALEHTGLDPAARFAAPFGRVVLNAVLLAGDSLPHGGVIRLAGGAADLFIQIDGPAAAWPAGLAACAVNAAEAHQALAAWRAPQMAMTTVLAHETGIRLSVLLGPSAAMQAPILRIGGG